MDFICCDNKQNLTNDIINCKKLRFEIYYIIMNQSRKTQYEIVLTQSMSIDQNGQKSAVIQKGSSFRSTNQDYQTIYKNFNLLSYFSPSSKIKILTRITNKQNGKQLNTDIFCFNNNIQEKYEIKQISKDTPIFQHIQYSNSPPTIKYLVSKIIQSSIQGQKQKLCEIIVKFKNDTKKITNKLQKQKNKILQENKDCQVIIIAIEDKSGWISENVQKFKNNAIAQRISQIRKSSHNSIQYFYVEPEDRRNRIFEYNHLSLAFQGGGCKGVQYIGAYKAILEKKKKIKSVIGSSAGGIIGLAVCCNSQVDKIVEISKQRLSVVISEDKKFKTIEDANAKQIIKNSYQKIYNVIKQLNIFDQYILQGFYDFFNDQRSQAYLLELIKLNTNEEVYKLFQNGNSTKQLNLAGLFNATLMTGDKIKDIAIEILMTYFTNFQKQNQKFLQKYPNLRQNINNNSNQKLEYKLDLSKKSQLKQICQKLTMEQLYEYTQIQFTCTSVDLKNHILRFFNQKTTPNLPVCRAVQMTGSFPVAFEAQRWKKQWGKYYVHYDYIRRQIDLEGCRFTDGGTLSNFPIKYLDNQEMRPMYFSHAKTKNTQIYGIGFISQPNQDLQKAAKKQQLVREMGSLLGSKFSKIRGAWQYFKSIFSSGPKQVQTNVTSKMLKKIKQQIPLFEFISNILETYSKTKDHLIEECFARISYDINADFVDKRGVKVIQSNQETINKLNNIIQKMDAKFQKDQKFDSIYKKFDANFEYLKNPSFPNKYREQSLMETQKILFFNIQKFFYFLSDGKQQKLKQFQNKLSKQFLLKLKVNQSEQINQLSPLKRLLIFLKQIGKSKTFVLCDVRKDYDQLIMISQYMREFCNQLIKQKNTSEQFSKALISANKKQYNLYSDFRQSLINFSAKLKENKSLIEMNKIKIIDNQNYKNQIKQIASTAQRISHLTLTYQITKIDQALQLLKVKEVPLFYIDYQTRIRDSINFKSYVLKRIGNYFENKQKNNNWPPTSHKNKNSEIGVHLVLQSVAMSELYFHKYFVMIQESLRRCNQKISEKNGEDIDKPSLALNRLREQMMMLKSPDPELKHVEFVGNNWSQGQGQTQKSEYLKVTTITVTGYQSLIAFLHASDMPIADIESQVWKLKQLIQIDREELRKRFENTNWLRLTPFLIRQIIDETDKSKNIFKLLQGRLQSTQYNEIVNEIQRSLGIVEATKQQVVEAIQRSLYFVTSIIEQIDDSKDTSQKKITQIIQSLALNTSRERMRDKLKNYESRLKYLANLFFGKYKDLLRYMTYNFPFIVDDMMKTLSQEDYKEAWKGLLVSKLLPIKPIKQYVQKILKRLSLDPNTTMKQFYQYSSKKIQLNLTVVQDNRVYILNHKSRPNMPLWAAMQAASSIPEFYEPVLDRQQWRRKIQTDYNMRQIKDHFFQKTRPYQFLSSSTLLTKMPLDLLQNNSLRPKITDVEDQIFILFNFEDQRRKQQSLLKQQNHRFRVTATTMAELVDNFVSFFSQNQNQQAIKLFPTISTFGAKVNLLQVYIESHDQLIKKLYKKQLVLMPIRFETLDFHQITKKNMSEDNQNQQLSDKCEDAIMQAKYIVKQKMENIFTQQQIVFEGRNINIQEIKIMGKQLFFKVGRRSLYFRIQGFGQLNKIKMRVLSLLNKSRQIHQQFFIYYKRDKTEVKLNSQDFVIQKQKQKPNTILHFKIQYPKIINKSIQAKQFKLDVTSLFDINNKVNLKLLQKKYSRFGLVYNLHFDVLHSQYNQMTKLLPVNKDDNDYMNNKLKQEDWENAAIGIKSEIKGRKQCSYVCQDCVLPYTLLKDKQSGLRYLKCQKCQKQYKLKQKYKIYTDPKEQVRRTNHKCILDHKLTQKKFDKKIVQFVTCDLCAKGYTSQVWYDQCGIIICEGCRSSLVYASNLS